MKPPLACRTCRVELVAEAEAARCPRCGARVERRDGIWRTGDAGAPAGFARERRDHLAELAARHFWFPPRRRLLARRLDLLGRRFAAALELGCGTGGFLGELAARADEVTGVDAWVASLEAARTVAPGTELIAADLELGVPLADGRFDLIVALDVLEHVDGDLLLAEIRRLAARDARLLIAVPAGPGLWSALDEAAGHRRRFDRAALGRLLAAHGCERVRTTHYQMLLWPLVYLSRRLAPRRLHRLERRPPAWLGRALGAVNAAEVGLFGRRSLPFGSSLVATAALRS